MEDYDSTEDTLKHANRVEYLLNNIADELMERGTIHDASKLEKPEKEGYDTFVPLLQDTEYGSEEYRNILSDFKETIDYHISVNSHHPEHYENGINGFDLIDLVEMFCDWIAASERSDTDFIEGMEINKKRFKISDQLYNILTNTAERYFI